MAKKGGSAHLKRISVPRFMFIRRKEAVWLAKPSPGAHRLRDSVPLLVVVRDLLKLADDSREARKVIKTGEVLVDAKRTRNERAPVGLMDVLSVPKMKKYFRVLLDNKERVKLAEIKEEQAKFKIGKILAKRTAPGGKIQISLHDGRSVLATDLHKVGDSVKLAVPEQKIEAAYKLEPGARCLITRGKHAGELAVVDEIFPGSEAREAEAKLHTDAGSFITVKKYLFVVGDNL
ncbi:MAG: 30S ribosomal protein S4e [Candidatus Micrarchaeota archaeon]